MTSTPFTAYSARGWKLIGLLRMLLATAGFVLAGSGAIPLALVMNGAWRRILAALVLINGHPA